MPFHALWNSAPFVPVTNTSRRSGAQAVTRGREVHTPPRLSKPVREGDQAVPFQAL